MFARAAVMLVLLAACERETPREAKRPDAKCLADEIGALHAEWNVPDVCESDLKACRKACSAGEGDACFYIATKNTATADDDDDDPGPLFERSCRDGLAIACTNWAATHWAAEPTAATPSLTCLYRVFAKSCDIDETFGCSMMARTHLEQPQTVVDKWIGFNQLTNACNRFDGPSCRFLAYYLERGDFGDSDPATIKQLLQRACDGGDEEACGKERAADTIHTRP